MTLSKERLSIQSNELNSSHTRSQIKPIYITLIQNPIQVAPRPGLPVVALSFFFYVNFISSFITQKPTFWTNKRNDLFKGSKSEYHPTVWILRIFSSWFKNFTFDILITFNSSPLKPAVFSVSPFFFTFNPSVDESKQVWSTLQDLVDDKVGRTFSSAHPDTVQPVWDPPFCDGWESIFRKMDIMTTEWVL